MLKEIKAIFVKFTAIISLCAVLTLNFMPEIAFGGDLKYDASLFDQEDEGWTEDEVLIALNEYAKTAQDKQMNHIEVPDDVKRASIADHAKYIRGQSTSTVLVDTAKLYAENVSLISAHLKALDKLSQNPQNKFIQTKVDSTRRTLKEIDSSITQQDDKKFIAIRDQIRTMRNVKVSPDTSASSSLSSAGGTGGDSDVRVASGGNITPPHNATLTKQQQEPQQQQQQQLGASPEEKQGGNPEEKQGGNPEEKQGGNPEEKQGGNPEEKQGGKPGEQQSGTSAASSSTLQAKSVDPVVSRHKIKHAVHQDAIDAKTQRWYEQQLGIDDANDALGGAD